MAKVAAVTNQKGGVGKTTTVFHMAHAALGQDKTTVVMDFDTQGNISQFLSGDSEIANQRGGIEQLFDGVEPVYTVLNDGAIQLLHGHRYLDALDRDSDATLEAAQALRDKVRSLPADYVLIDTPPSIGPRQVAPMLWADLVVIVVEPHQTAMTGLASIFDTVELAKAVNPALQVRLVINRFNRRSKQQNEVVQALRDAFGTQILGEMTATTSVPDAIGEAKPVWQFARGDKKVRDAWRSLSDRILQTIV